MMAIFKKVECKKKYTLVAEQIADAIKRGTFAVGAKLPSERELAESMGVSRPLIREALSGLQLTGIVESRAGDGTYVTQTVENLEEAYLAFTPITESVNLREAYEVRNVLEQGIVRIACQKATSEDFDNLNQCLQALTIAASKQDFEKFNNANYRFHLALAQAAHNHMLICALESLLDVMFQTIPQRLLQMSYMFSQDRFDDSLTLHQKIYDALQTHDHQKVAQAMQYHFDVISRDKSESKT